MQISGGQAAGGCLRGTGSKNYLDVAILRHPAPLSRAGGLPSLLPV